MWELITGLPGLISGFFGTINGITKALSDAKIEQIRATTQEEKIHADERVRTLEGRRDLMIAESTTSKLNIYVRSAIALGPASVLLKIFLWDKVVGSFAGCAGRQLPGTCQTFLTDSLDPNLWQVVMVVLGFYFLYEGATSLTRIIKR